MPKTLKPAIAPASRSGRDHMRRVALFRQPCLSRRSTASLATRRVEVLAMAKVGDLVAVRISQHDLTAAGSVVELAS